MITTKLEPMQDQRNYLREIVSDEVLNSIEIRLRRSHNKYNVRVALAVLLIFASFALSISQPAGYDFLIGLVGYLVGVVIITVLASKHREFFTFTNIIVCMAKVEQAKRTKPGSRERLRLGKKLIVCSKRMRSFGARIPVRLPKRIVTKEARQCALLFRKLIYPAMLGTDEELDQVKETLAQAALRIGAGNWLQLKALEALIIDYPFLRGAPEWFSVPILLPVVVAMLPPLLSILAHL